MSSTSIKFTSCKTVQLPRKTSGARPLPVPCAFKRDEAKGEGIWGTVQAAAPAVALTCAMLLSSGAAGAATLNQGYGGSVPGTDTQREVVETGLNKARDAGDNLLSNLPTPNLPTPESVSASPPAKTVQGAFDKTVSNVARAFDFGGNNISDAGEGVGNQIKDGLQDLSNKTPGPNTVSGSFGDVLQAGRDKAEERLDSVTNKLLQSNTSDDVASGAKNVFSSGADKVQDALKSGANSGAKNLFSAGADKVQDALQSGADSAQDAAGKALSGGAKRTFINNAVSGPASQLANNAAQDAKRAIETGANQVQDKSGNIFDDAKAGVERLVAGTAGDAIKSGADQAGQALKSGASKIQSDTASPGDVAAGAKDLFSSGADKVQEALKSGASGAQDAAGKVAGGARRTYISNPASAPAHLMQLVSNPVDDAQRALQSGANQIQNALPSTGNPLSGLGNPLDALDSGKAQVERSISGGAQSAKQGLNSATSGDAPKTFKDAKDQAFEGLSGEGLQKNTAAAPMWNGKSLLRLVNNNEQETFKQGGLDLSKVNNNGPQSNGKDLGSSVQQSINSVQEKGAQFTSPTGVESIVGNVKSAAQEAGRQSNAQADKALKGFGF